ncbi:MAG: DUF6089 family protein [Chitinophagales bacterium]|nr:outer membrane beta-barrel protein [Bacteroidota bacterium]
MKKITQCLILLIIFISVPYGAQAQYDGSGHDVGFSVGPNFSLTDLGGAKKIGSPFIRDVDFKSTRFCISAFYRYNVNKFFAVRANLMYGMISADDKNTDGIAPDQPNGPSDSWYRARRNLNFSTHIVEFQAMAEVNLKKYMHNQSKGSKERWAPYIGGGLGFFYFNPYTKLNGEKVKLRPLGTEGQTIGVKKMYSNFQFDLIALVGIKYNVTNKFSIALEGIYHQTFTDYLDDVSGNYVNPDQIASLDPTAQILQNRANTGNYPDNAFNFVEGQKKSDGSLNVGGSGNQRGDSKDNDQFFHVQLTFSFAITGKSLGGGGRKNPYNVKFSCPRW